MFLFHLVASFVAAVAPKHLLTRPAVRFGRLWAVGTNHDDDDDDGGVGDCLERRQWETVSNLVTIQSPWVTILGERLKDPKDKDGNLMDYWRVEKEHSAVILTLYKGRIIFPKPSYRPGVGAVTLDFCGGRVPHTTADLETTATTATTTAPLIASKIVPAILHRELGVLSNDIDHVKTLTDCGWPINSSFSNQLLFGFVATLSDNAKLDPEKLYEKSFALDEVDLLLRELRCLQCRHVLLEFLRLRNGG